MSSKLLGLVGSDNTHLLTDKLLYKGFPFLAENGTVLIKEGQEFIVKEFLDLLLEKINPEYSDDIYKEIELSLEKEVTLAWRKEKINSENLAVFFKKLLFETAKRLKTEEKEKYFVNVLEGWLFKKRGLRNIFVEIFQDYLSDESKDILEKRGDVDILYKNYCEVFYLPIKDLREFDKDFFKEMRIPNFKEMMIGGILTQYQTFHLLRMEIESLNQLLSFWFTVEQNEKMNNKWIALSKNYDDYGSKNLINFINQLDASWVMRKKDVQSDEEYRKYEPIWKRDFLSWFKDEAYSKRITEFLVSSLISTKNNEQGKAFSTEIYECFNELYLQKEYIDDNIIFEVSPSLMLKMQYFLIYASQWMEKEMGTILDSNSNREYVHEISFKLDMLLRKIDEKERNYEIDIIQRIEINESSHKEELREIERKMLPAIKGIYLSMLGDNFINKVNDLKDNGVDIEIYSKEGVSGLGRLYENIYFKCPKLCEENIEKILREVPLDNVLIKNQKVEVLFNELLFKMDVSHYKMESDIPFNKSIKKHKKF